MTSPIINPPIINPMDLTGRNVLVTGASSGIGRETSILLSQLGATITLSGRNQEQLDHTRGQLHGQGHQTAPFEMTRLEEIPAWIKDLAAAHGPFHGVVHSSGIHKAIPVRLLGPAAIDEIMRINVYSAAMLARGFRQKGCRAEGIGSIVFLASVAGIVGEAGVAAYSASKAALLGLTRSLAIELAPEKIRVNTIAPGFVQSEMGDRLKQGLTPDQFSVIERKHPLGIGHVRDVANGIAFLLADSSRWITGTTLVIDGGYTAH
jgi:NAD(P)-dependent dehydrogenase (short-subunit alcohol dehydrogenase family)